MKILILSLVIIVRGLFLLIDENDRRHWTYPANGEIIYLQNFTWYIGEFSAITALSFMSLFRDNYWGLSVRVFAFLTIFDLLDFLITGNRIWYSLNGFPVSSNTLIGFVFALTFMYEYMKYGKSGWLKD